MLLILTSAAVYALPEDRDQPIQVKAQNMQWNNQQQLAVYQGQVEVVQGQLLLQSDLLNLQRTATGELKQAVATNKQGLAYMRDLPDAAKPEVEAWGEKLDYQPINNLIIITGQAKLVQGADKFTGHKLTYNLITQDIQAEQANKDDARVEVILTPAKKPNNE